MYYQWEKDQEEEQKRLQNLGILIGGFFNPQMAQKMMQNENPTYESNEELHQKTLEEMKAPLPENKEPKKKRKKKVSIREIRT